MTVVLFTLGGLLALWGFYVMAALDSIAAIDVGSQIVVGGALVAGLGAVVRSLDRLRRQMVEAAAGQHRHEPAVIEAEPPVEPALATPPKPARPGPAPTAHTPPSVEPARSVPGFLMRSAPVAPPVVPAAAIAAAASDAPSLLREGQLNGVSYRFFSDGSVEAEDDSGPRRYASVEALRETILSRRGASAPAHERQDVAEDIGAGAPEPFVDDHFGGDDVDTVAGEPWQGDLSGVRPPRADAIRDDGDVESFGDESDRGLQHADVGFQPADDDLAPPLEPPFGDPSDEDGLFHRVEGDLGDDVDPFAEPGGQRRESWAESLRMLLRRDRGDAEPAGGVDQKPEGGDDAFDAGDRR